MSKGLFVMNNIVLKKGREYEIQTNGNQKTGSGAD